MANASQRIQVAAAAAVWLVGGLGGVDAELMMTKISGYAHPDEEAASYEVVTVKPSTNLYQRE